MPLRILAVVVALIGALVSLAVFLGQDDRPTTEPAQLSTPDAPPVEVARKRPPLRLAFVQDSAVVRVRVTSEVGGRPLAGVRVGVVLKDKPKAVDRIGLTRDSRGRPHYTGPDGVVELGLDPGVAYAIVGSSTDPAQLPGSVQVEPLLAADEVRTIDLALPARRDTAAEGARVRLHARLVDRVTGAPIRGARVGESAGWDAIAPGDERRTDDDGRFVVESAPSRRRVVNVIAAGYEPAFVAPIAGHATPESALEIALARTASARVKVVDADGAPIAGLEASFETSLVHFGRPDEYALLDAGSVGDATYHARTDEHGVAVFTDLPPNVPLDGRLERKHHEMFRALEDLVLAPSEAREITWRVGGGCVLGGVALETDGKPAARLAIALEPTWANAPLVYLVRGDSRGRRLAVTDRDGRFAFEDVGPGVWWIGPASEDSGGKAVVGPDEASTRAQVVTVARDATSLDVEIRVQRGLTISGRALGPDGAPVRNASIEYVRATGPVLGNGSTRFDANGRFVLGPLEDGEHELRASANGFLASERVVARAGDTDVVLRLRPAGAIHGVVVERTTGTPSAARMVVAARPIPDGLVWVPRTDANGAFRLDGLAPGVYDVAARTSSGRFGLARGVEVAIGTAREVRIEVEPGARIRVRHDGPAQYGTVSVLSGDTLVAKDDVRRGTDAVIAVPTGTLVVRMRGHEDARQFDLAVTLKVGETRDLVFDGAWK